MEFKNESFESQPSKVTELTILTLGANFYNWLTNAERLDELELMISVVSAYGVMVSDYAEKSGRIEESLAVDLTEAVLMKIESLNSDDKNQEWSHYAQQFRDSLQYVSDEYDLNLSFDE